MEGRGQESGRGRKVRVEEARKCEWKMLGGESGREEEVTAVLD